MSELIVMSIPSPDLSRSFMSSPNKSQLIRYQYDPLDRLTSHTQLDGLVRQRFYAEDHLITELQGEEQLSIIRHEDLLLAQQWRSLNDVNMALLASDQQRSVLCTVQKNVQHSFSYTAYGHRISEYGLISLLGFTGQRADPVTGQYLLGNGYRSFNPVLMRFNSSDSLSPFGKGGLNPYCYCGGDPTNRIDPTGHIFRGVSRFLKKIFSSSAAAKPAPLFRAKLKRVEIMRFADDAHLIFDTYKEAPRITIRGHGGKDGFFRFSNKTGPVTDDQLIAAIEAQNVKIKDYQYMRLVSCYGADVPTYVGGESLPLGQRLADETGLKVKAFHGPVRRNEFDAMELGAPARAGNFGMFKMPMKHNKKKSDYFPTYFEPRKIRQGP